MAPPWFMPKDPSPAPCLPLVNVYSKVVRWSRQPGVPTPQPTLNSRVRPDIRQVAAEAGVSTATVSRVLTGKGPASEDATRRVRAAADRLGYSPSAPASSLRTERSMIIGVLVPNLANPVFLPFLRAVEHLAQQHGYAVIVADAQRSPEVERRQLDRLSAQRIDALVVAGRPWTRPRPSPGRSRSSRRRRRGVRRSGRLSGRIDRRCHRRGLRAPGRPGPSSGDVPDPGELVWGRVRHPVAPHRACGPTSGHDGGAGGRRRPRRAGRTRHGRTTRTAWSAPPVVQPPSGRAPIPWLPACWRGSPSPTWTFPPSVRS